MSTQIDWREELDSSFGRAPDVPAAHYVVAGHKAVRRRRLQAGAAGLATAAIIAGIGWAIAPEATPRSSDNVATNPTTAISTPTAEAPTATPDHRMPWRKQDPPARTTFGAGLEIREGAVVHERRDDLYPGKDTESVALDISYEGTRWWVKLEWDEGGGGFTSTKPGEMYASFDAFVAAEIAQGGMTNGPVRTGEDNNWARLTTDGLKTDPGVEVLAQIDNPLGLAAPKSSLGVELRKDGAITWALLDSAPGGGGGSYEFAAQSGWLTLEQWVTAEVALQTGEPGIQLVTMSDNGMLEQADSSIVITEHRMDPDLPAYIDPSVTQSAIAKVLWEGETWFVLAIRIPGGEDSFTTFAASKADGAETINQFEVFARSRADEGGGLR